MHTSLAELLENLKPGLLWVARDGTVRYANGEGTARTGLATGRKLYDPDLMRAVTAAIVGRVPRQVAAVGVKDTERSVSQELRCRVIPGLASDDAFVLIGHDVTHDDGVGYDNLMQVIRADVRDPLREAQAALSLWENQGTGGPELSAMTDSLSALLGVVDRLVDLAAIWDSSALLATDRIELWPLLQQAWGGVEPLAMQRSVKVRFHAQTEAGALATLYGSEHWLGRVFEECMEAAVRSGRSGDTLEIEHRQMGPRALVVFRDCGAFAPPATQDAVSMPAAPRGKPAAAPRLAARDQIGLKLCRHIVSLHGGQLREEEEGGLRNFLIDLPTGAPHRNDHSQLDVAQAQQYARDLAALMSRARTRKAAAGTPN
jgi:light-regulated signal transduction histidine kinase (bacteriophytochrome)